MSNLCLLYVPFQGLLYFVLIFQLDSTIDKIYIISSETMKPSYNFEKTLIPSIKIYIYINIYIYTNNLKKKNPKNSRDPFNMGEKLRSFFH